MAPGAHTHRRPHRHRHRHRGRHRRTRTAERGEGEPGTRGRRPRGRAAGLAPAHRLGQRPPAPANTLLSPQVGANRFCLLQPPGGGGGGFPALLWPGAPAEFPCNLGGGRGRARAPAAAASLTSHPAPQGAVLTRGPLHPAYMGGILQGPGRPSLAGKLDPSGVQEFQPAPTPAHREGSGSGACPAPGSRARRSTRPSPRLWPDLPHPPRSPWVELSLTVQT